MCQLNVYMIDKYISGCDVKDIFNKHHHKNFDSLNSEITIRTYDDDYNYFEASNNHCDCGSVIGLIRDQKGKYNTYTDYLNANDKQHITKLYKIRDFLYSPDHEEVFNNINTTKTRMFDKLQRYQAPIINKDIEISEITVKPNLNFQDQVRLKRLTQEKKQLEKDLENNKEYNYERLSYEDFVKRNEHIIASEKYTLENKKDWWQANIDFAISHAEHETHSHAFAEFNHMKIILNDILKLTDQVKLFSFWQSDAKYENDYFNSLTETKTTKLSDLKLEDLIFLDFKEVVTVTR